MPIKRNCKIALSRLRSCKCVFQALSLQTRASSHQNCNAHFIQKLVLFLQSRLECDILRDYAPEMLQENSIKYFITLKNNFLLTQIGRSIDVLNHLPLRGGDHNPPEFIPICILCVCDPWHPSRILHIPPLGQGFLLF